MPLVDRCRWPLLLAFGWLGGAEVFGQVAPANNVCGSAPIISGTGMFPYNNAAATTDGVSHVSGCAGADPQIWKDVWWQWVASCGGPVTVSTCGLTTTNSKLAVYGPGGPCPPSDDYLISCDDDGCDGTRSTVTFVATPGQIYRIRVGVFGNGPGGAGSVLISCDDGALCSADLCQPDSGFTGLLSAGVPLRAADSFVPVASGVATSVCWWGVYLTNPQGAPPVDEVKITYFADNAGRPGAPLAAFVQGQTIGSPTRQDVGLDFDGTFHIFESVVSHPPVPVTSGTKYWVAITNSGGTDWGWNRSLVGDGQCWRDSTPATGWGDAASFAFDLAFCIGIESGCDLDVNGDGEVGFGDLNLILSEFNTVCP